MVKPGLAMVKPGLTPSLTSRVSRNAAAIPDTSTVINDIYTQQIQIQAMP